MSDDDEELPLAVSINPISGARAVKASRSNCAAAKLLLTLRVFLVVARACAGSNQSTKDTTYVSRSRHADHRWVPVLACML